MIPLVAGWAVLLATAAVVGGGLGAEHGLQREPSDQHSASTAADASVDGGTANNYILRASVRSITANSGPPKPARTLTATKALAYNITPVFRAPWYQEPPRNYPPPNQIAPAPGSRCAIPPLQAGGTAHPSCVPVTVLLFGLTGREGPRTCTPAGRAWQNQASLSQTRALLLPLAREGNDVRVFIATQPCPDPGGDKTLAVEQKALRGGSGKWNWLSILGSYYAPFKPTMVPVKSGSCPYALGKIMHVLAAAGGDRLAQGHVIMSRPDLVWRPQEVLGLLGGGGGGGGVVPEADRVQRALKALGPMMSGGAAPASVRRRLWGDGHGIERRSGMAHHRMEASVAERRPPPPNSTQRQHANHWEREVSPRRVLRGYTPPPSPANRSTKPALSYSFRLPSLPPGQYTLPESVVDPWVVKGMAAPTMIFPFPCENWAWQSYHCVADTLISMPSAIFLALQSSCLGYQGCFGVPRGRSLKSCKVDRKSDPQLEPWSRNLPEWLVGGKLPDIPPTSGHACMLCLRGALDALLATTDGGSGAFMEGFLDVKLRRVNTRVREGINPLYFIGGSDQFPTLSRPDRHEAKITKH